jgi:TPR repeat protein
MRRGHHYKEVLMKTIVTPGYLSLTLLVLCLICVPVEPLSAQYEDTGYPADEKNFMAEAFAANRAGDNSIFHKMVVIGCERGYAEAEVYGAIFLLNSPINGEKEKSYDAARKYLERAASKGHTKAMLILSAIYADGVMVPPDYNMSKYWLVKAASAGDNEAIEQCREQNIKYK